MPVMPEAIGFHGRLHAALPWALCLLAGLAPPAAAQLVQPLTFEIGGALPARLHETSGVAVSRRHRGLLWTHNDSGDGPIIYAIDLSGRLLGAYQLDGADAVDWEDIALGPCPAQDDDCLYVADTGDNLGRRRSVQLYVLPEPPPPAGSGRPSRVPARRIDVTFPTGPRDVEALAVRSDATVLLVTKGGSRPAEVYQLSARQLRGDSATAAPRGHLPAGHRAVGRWVTGAAFSPRGLLAVRTYTSVTFYRWTDRLQAVGPVCWLGGREPQGEAIDFLDETTLVLTTEAGTTAAGFVARARCPPPRDGSAP